MPELNLHVVQRHINEIISRKRSGEAHPALSDSVIEALAELAECELQRRKELTSAAPTLADTQLQADIEALRTRVANLEFALHPESSRRQAVSVSETCRADAFRQAVAYVVKQEIDKALRIGGAINRAFR